ncbi:uncharacterized protein EAF01_011357 [Botrytis porri]|uniref:PLD phosphodiesterase domain-containing protein n=1 Tax=Botrytis porri TaxID=87229 RepID=A0A4Z1KSL8_9HELO|nr:uncharacterized protein EAF01_011357 [Botrytis porri]KAF7885292.1 hypothetical protein EAF01_011357 [Botrytis porri]TGO86049.1 hypothetical protein BPOR_0340g00090 [Botrytis porri]
MDQHQSQDSDELAQKDCKLDDIANDNDNTNTKIVPRGIHRSISPPPLRRRRMESPKPAMLEKKEANPNQNQREVNRKPDQLFKQGLINGKNLMLEHSKQEVVKSPFQLTTIRDLPASSNVDAVSLKDILGDPLISECWEFNYLHNLDFLMEQFDEDVRNLVRVNVIHGFWKREDQSRLNLTEQASKYPNIKLLTAYMPEMFGTHHSKMLILFRHDSTAQIIIHTANMIPFDWTNMTQALWKSPHLPLFDLNRPASIEPTKLGSGSKFKLDLLNYLRAYDTKRIICKPLVEQLLKYDFSEIKAALIGSVPGKQGIEQSPSQTAWGWAGLTNALKSVPCYQNTQPEIVIQISSIASLDPTDKWLTHFFKALNASKSPRKTNSKLKIIFPTADEVRRSINGYASGNAIHTKILTPAQGKQLAYLEPMLCHWAGDGAQHSSSSSMPSNSPSQTSQSSTPPELKIQEAYRKRAAPHIKTYIRFSSDTSSNSSSQKSIDWMLVTSANLSKQAWGEPVNSAGEVRICSYEIGVLVWPDLWEEKQNGKKVKMVPCFGSDTPSTSSSLELVNEQEKVTNGGEAIGKRKRDDEGEEKGDEESNTIIVGARMPYDLPLVPYGKDDTPWCASASYSEPDWMGNTWKT